MKDLLGIDTCEFLIGMFKYVGIPVLIILGLAWLVYLKENDNVTKL